MIKTLYYPNGSPLLEYKIELDGDKKYYYPAHKTWNERGFLIFEYKWIGSKEEDIFRNGVCKHFYSNGILKEVVLTHEGVNEGEFITKNKQQQPSAQLFYKIEISNI